MTPTAATVTRWLRGLRWYVREVTGESAYDRYVERERHQHPGVAVLDRRAFERRRQDLVDSQPQQRCC